MVVHCVNPRRDRSIRIRLLSAVNTNVDSIKESPARHRNNGSHGGSLDYAINYNARISHKQVFCLIALGPMTKIDLVLIHSTVCSRCFGIDKKALALG